jgi:TATA-binding protein-associated factor Taf7
MKTSFSVKVTGSITVSIEPSNEDEDGGCDANGGGSILEVFLASYMKSLVNEAVKKYVRDKDTTVEEEEEDDGLFITPMPKRRVPLDDDDDDDDDGEADVAEATVEEDEEDEEDEEEEDEVVDENNVSQKMDMMNLRHRH